MRFALIAVAAILFASPALAQGVAPPAPAAPAEQAAAQDDAAKPVCKKERVAGSNRPEKICKTAAEWQRLREAAKRGPEGRRPVGPQDSKATGPGA
ncbi:MAG: hypothetical protein Q7T61_02020 [Caulobacter sp.]|nr:hypothetical protein [Caulobacter sp.]